MTIKNEKKNISKTKKTKNALDSNEKEVSSEIAFQKIKQMMYQNYLKPGQKILYHDLAKKLNLSITPIGHALGKLSIMKLVSYELNRGYFVRMINTEETKELYAAREALETYIIPEVIKKLTQKKLKAIKSGYKSYDNSNGQVNPRMLLMRDLGMHLKIAEIAGNTVICELLEGIFERIYLGYRTDFLSQERINLNIKQHRSIIDALEKRDVDRAIECTKEHIKTGMNFILRTIRSEDDFFSGVSDFAVG